MRHVLLSAAVLAGVICAGIAPARAIPQPTLTPEGWKTSTATVEKAGWRRYYGGGYAYPSYAPQDTYCPRSYGDYQAYGDGDYRPYGDGYYPTYGDGDYQAYGDGYYPTYAGGCCPSYPSYQYYGR
jgi:hypothetical protein